MTSTDNYLLTLNEVLKPTINLTLKANHDTINYVKKYNKQVIEVPPRNKIDTKIKQLKSETIYKLEFVTVDIELLIKRLDKLHLTKQVINVYYKLNDVALKLWNTRHHITYVYQLEFFYPLTKRIYKTRYRFKREIVKRLNTAKRGLNKALKQITQITKRIDKLEKESQTPVRLILNSNNWLNGILENKYNRIATPEAVATNNNLVTVEEKRKIKQKLKKQI